MLRQDLAHKRLVQEIRNPVIRIKVRLSEAHLQLVLNPIPTETTDLQIVSALSYGCHDGFFLICKEFRPDYFGIYSRFGGRVTSLVPVTRIVQNLKKNGINSARDILNMITIESESLFYLKLRQK